MLVLLHVIIALSSIVLAGAALLAPSQLKLRLSQALIGLTMVSGIYLVATTHVNLLKVCTVGLVYTAIVSWGTLAASRKLAQATADSRR